MSTGRLDGAPLVPTRGGFGNETTGLGIAKSLSEWVVRVVDDTPPGTAVMLASGRVYVSLGGNFGDCGPYKGWVLGAPPDSAEGEVVNYSVPTGREGAIWAPPGPSIRAGSCSTMSRAASSAEARSSSRSCGICALVWAA